MARPLMGWVGCPACRGTHPPMPYTVEFVAQDAQHPDQRYPGHPFRALMRATCPTTGQPIETSQCLGAMPPSYTCAWCGRTSYHPQDVVYRYCSCCGSEDGLLPKDCEHHRRLEERRN